MTHPDPPKQAAAKTAHRPADDPGRAIADALARDQDALRGDMEAIGRDFRKALEPFVEQVRAAVIDKLLPYGCPLCDQRMTTAIGAKAHYNVGHSWWERATFRAADMWSMLRAAFVDLFTTTIFMPRWAAIAAVAALSAAAAIGWWTR